MFINGDQWLIVVLNWITLWKSNMASWKVHEQNGGWHEDICGLCIFSDIHYGWGIDGSSSKSKSTVLQQSQKDKRVTNPTKIANGTLSIIWRWICFFYHRINWTHQYFWGNVLAFPSGCRMTVFVLFWILHVRRYTMYFLSSSKEQKSATCIPTHVAWLGWLGTYPPYLQTANGEPPFQWIL